MPLIVDCKSSSQYWNRTDITMLYFDDIKRFKLLDEDEEKKLFKIIKHGTEEEKTKAKEKIIQANQRFVVSVARRWANQNNLLDLINEANIGLINAIDTFDDSKDARFITWAVWWIRKELNAFLIKNEGQVKTKNAHVIFTCASKIKNEFYAKEGRYPTVYELKDIIKEKYNYNIAYDEDLYDLTLTSIDEPYSTDNDDSYCTVEDNSEYSEVSSTCNIDDYIENEHIKSLIDMALSNLSDIEATVLKKTYGIDEIRGYKIEEIASQLNMSGERVRQIRFKALNKLRNNADTIKHAV